MFEHISRPDYVARPGTLDGMKDKKACVNKRVAKMFMGQTSRLPS